MLALSRIAANVPPAAFRAGCGALHCPPMPKVMRAQKLKIRLSARLQAGRQLGAVFYSLFVHIYTSAISYFSAKTSK